MREANALQAVESFCGTKQGGELEAPLALFMEERNSLLLEGPKPAFQKKDFDLRVQEIKQQEQQIWRTKTLDRMDKNDFKSRRSGSQIHSEPCRYVEFKYVLS
jgi:hypothetical protein